MRHRRPAALAVAALAFAASAAPLSTAAESDAFDPLVAELEHRRDDDLASPADGTQKKQLKAVVKALAAIDRSSTTTGDAKTAGKVTASLQKAFADEFSPHSHEASLPGLVSGLFSVLTEEAHDDLAAVDARVGSLPENLAPKVQKQVDAGEAALADAEAADDTDYKARSRAIGKAQKFAGKGNRIADKAPAPSAQITATIGAAPFASTQYSQAEVRDSDDGLQVYGTGTNAGGQEVTLYIQAVGVPGPGTYSLDVTNANANLQVRTAPNPPTIHPKKTGGTITVTTFDPPNRVAGTFSLSVDDLSGGSILITGSFDITENIYMQP